MPYKKVQKIHNPMSNEQHNVINEIRNEGLVKIKKKCLHMKMKIQ